MKSKISLFNQAVFKKNLTRGWMLWAGLLVIYMWMLPMNAFNRLTETSRYQNYGQGTEVALEAALPFVMTTSVWSVLRVLVPLFAMAALLCAMHVFSYLFTARNSNMMHTYPVTRVSLFFTNFISGFLSMFAPLVTAALVTLAVGAAQGAVNAQVLQYYGIWLLTVFVENLFFFCMAVCVLMFVGNIIAVPALYLVLNFLYEGCMFIAASMIQAVCYGLDHTVTMDGFGVLTPMIFFRRVGLTFHYDYEEPAYTFQRMGTLPGYLIVAIVFGVIALAAYEKKHIETAGDVITVNWLKPIFRWGMAVCTSSLGALLLRYTYDTKSFISIMISVSVIGIIVFFIAQMLLERSIYVFTKRKIKECLLYTVIICGCYVALDLDVLGLEKKIPNTDEIAAVHVEGGIRMLATNEDEISWVHEIHRQIVDAKRDFERRTADRTQMNQYVYLEYLLKDNSTMTRRYEIPMDDTKESVFGQMVEYAGREEVTIKEMFGIHYPDIEIYGGRWIAEEETRNADGTNIYVGNEKRISEADAKQLYEAVKQDVADGNVRADIQWKDTNGTADLPYYGQLILDVRDEAGYYNTANYDVIREYRSQSAMKDGNTTISVDGRYTYLLKKMRELGYLTKKEP